MILPSLRALEQRLELLRTKIDMWLTDDEAGYNEATDLLVDIFDELKSVATVREALEQALEQMPRYEINTYIEREVAESEVVKLADLKAALGRVKEPR